MHYYSTIRFKDNLKGRKLDIRIENPVVTFTHTLQDPIIQEKSRLQFSIIFVQIVCVRKDLNLHNSFERG